MRQGRIWSPLIIKSDMPHRQSLSYDMIHGFLVLSVNFNSIWEDWVLTHYFIFIFSSDASSRVLRVAQLWVRVPVAVIRDIVDHEVPSYRSTIAQGEKPCFFSSEAPGSTADTSDEDLLWACSLCHHNTDNHLSPVTQTNWDFLFAGMFTKLIRETNQKLARSILFCHLWDKNTSTISNILPVISYIDTQW